MTPEEKIATGRLIPLNTRPKGEHRLIAQKGGQSKGKTKSDGQKLRQVKLRIKNDPELSEEDKNWILAKSEERPAFGVAILAEIQKLKKDIHPSQRVALLNTELGVGKFLHGEKIITESTNLNLNLSRDLSDDELFEFKEFLNRRNEK